MKNLQLYIIIGLIGIVILLFWLWNGARIQSNEKDSIITEKSDSIKYHINKFGQVVAEKEAALINLGNFKKSYSSLEADVNKRLGVKTRNLVAVYKGEFKATGHGEVKISTSEDPFLMDGLPLGEDTTRRDRDVHIYDGYLDFNGVIKQSTFSYDYDYYDTLLLSFSKTKHFFKGTTISATGMLSNKNAKITHTTGVVIQTVKPKRFNISIGFYYDPFRAKFGPAVTAGYALVRF